MDSGPSHLRDVPSQRRTSLRKPGGSRFGDDSREGILSTSYSPGVLATVAGNRVRGFVSQSEIEKWAPESLPTVWRGPKVLRRSMGVVCASEETSTTKSKIERKKFAYGRRNLYAR